MEVSLGVAVGPQPDNDATNRMPAPNSPNAFTRVCSERAAMDFGGKCPLGPSALSHANGDLKGLLPIAAGPKPDPRLGVVRPLGLFGVPSRTPCSGPKQSYRMPLYLTLIWRPTVSSSVDRVCPASRWANRPRGSHRCGSGVDPGLAAQDGTAGGRFP